VVPRPPGRRGQVSNLFAIHGYYGTTTREIANGPDRSRPVPGETSQEAILSDIRRRSVEEAFTAMAPRLWRALLLYSGNRELADDAFSEAFAQAIAASSSIRDVRAWVWTVAFKIAAGEMRRLAGQGGRTSGARFR